MPGKNDIDLPWPRFRRVEDIVAKLRNASPKKTGGKWSDETLKIAALADMAANRGCGKNGNCIGTSRVEEEARRLVARRCKQTDMHGRVENAARGCALLARLRSAPSRAA